MAHFMQEVVVSGSSEDECVHLWDLSTATTLVSYRPAAPATAAAVVPIGRDFLAIAQAAKASLHVFQVCLSRNALARARVLIPHAHAGIAGLLPGRPGSKGCLLTPRVSGKSGAEISRMPACPCRNASLQWPPHQMVLTLPEARREDEFTCGKRVAERCCDRGKDTTDH